LTSFSAHLTFHMPRKTRILFPKKEATRIISKSLHHQKSSFALGLTSWSKIERNGKESTMVAKRVSSSTNLTGHPALQLLPQPSLVVPPPPKALVMLLTRRVTCNKPPPLQAEAGSPHNKPVSTIPVVVPMQVKNPRTYFFKIQITKIPTPSKATPPPLIQS